LQQTFDKSLLFCGIEVFGETTAESIVAPDWVLYAILGSMFVGGFMVLLIILVVVL
jgi:hypothetical protein